MKENINKLRKKADRFFNIVKIHGYRVAIVVYATKPPVLNSLFRLIFGRLLIKIKIMNNDMFVDLNDPGISMKLISEGIKEVGHVRQLRENLKPGMKGIDIGSNIGYYALIESEILGSEGFVFSIEPEADNLKLLRKNIKLNNAERIFKVSQYLVGDHNGVERFYLSSCSNRHSLSAIDKIGSVNIPMITVDKFMADNGLLSKDINFIRMDIEGYEVIAFQGMKSLMDARTPMKIFIELHSSYYPQWGWTLEKFVQLLFDKGFTFKAISYEKGAEEFFMYEPSIAQVLETQNRVNGFQACLERA
ncbi:MAG: FkbM family methyltransferase [Candidatus Moranbacteria bacterium GW2011_GWF2_35_39]|nr:MAG: FkbM family methyltransferase [Candidatus Moranbacteria bacterium GW2011_GWF2_35_39]